MNIYNKSRYKLSSKTSKLMVRKTTNSYQIFSGIKKAKQCNRDYNKPENKTTPKIAKQSLLEEWWTVLRMIAETEEILLTLIVSEQIGSLARLEENESA